MRYRTTCAPSRSRSGTISCHRDPHRPEVQCDSCCMAKKIKSDRTVKAALIGSRISGKDMCRAQAARRTTDDEGHFRECDGAPIGSALCDVDCLSVAEQPEVCSIIPVKARIEARDIGASVELEVKMVIHKTRPSNQGFAGQRQVGGTVVLFHHEKPIFVLPCEDQCSVSKFNNIGWLINPECSIS